MKTRVLLLSLLSGVAFANPPKPSHSGEVPWAKALPDKRDAEFEKKVVNGSNVVVDTRFNWMWQNKLSEKMEWYDAHAYCEQSTYAGYSDWKLPGYWQVQSIVDHFREGQYVYSAFSSVKPDNILWTRDDSVNIDQPDSDDRWAYFPDLGMTTWEVRNQKFNALCIRGEDSYTNTASGANRFVEEKPDLIKDQRTGLFWTAPRDTKVSNYSMWTVPMPWGQAYHYCQTLSFGGMDGWRLPTMQELKMLLAVDRRSPATWIPKMPGSFYWIWSSDVVERASRTWVIQSNGQNLTQDASDKNTFGCVHE